MTTKNSYFIHLASIILASFCWYTLESKTGLVQIDGTHSIIYTSPLSTGSNSSNLLKVDVNRAPDCITTTGTGISWVLIDLGFIVPGIVQLRLYADTFNDDTHKHLSSVEIKMAQKLPIKPISNFAQIENTHFRLCGNTGIVSQDTFNAVVDCKSEFSVRWILLKKKSTLNLCHISILQNAVQPQCFLSLLRNNSIYSKATSNLDVFKSMRHLTSIECFQNCYAESTCYGVAFIPISLYTGICQLLRKKSSTLNLFCDEICQLSINVCHLGQKIKIGKSDRDIIIAVPPIKENSYALSVEISGEISCNNKYCGETGIFIMGSNKKLNPCGRIDPLMFRIVYEVFLCDQPVKDPLEIILKTESNDTEYRYEFKSISLRIIEENSFILDVLEYYKTSHLYKTSSRSTKTTPMTTSTVKYTTLKTNIINSSSFYSSYTISSKASTSIKTVRPMSSMGSSSLKSSSTNKNTTLSTRGNTASSSVQTSRSISLLTSSHTKKKSKETAMTLSSSLKTNKPSSTKAIVSTSYIQVPRSTSLPISLYTKPRKISSYSKSIKPTFATQLLSLKTSLIKGNTTLSTDTITVKSSVQMSPSTSTVTSTDNTKIKIKLQEEGKNELKIMRRTKERNFGEYTVQTLFNRNQTTTGRYIYKQLEATTNSAYIHQAAAAPYIWIILVLFVSILIFVILVVILVTFLESRRKRKEWDIPPNGLFPMEHEQITMQSSLHECTFKKVS